MKNYLTLVSMLFLVPMWAQRIQQTNIRTQQPSESNAPKVLDNEAKTFLEQFQKGISYLADKKYTRSKRRTYATSFASRFAADAMIQVMNGDDTKSFKPIDYFNRLIDLNYDQVSIQFEVIRQTPFQQVKDAWWQINYELLQHFKATRNRKISEDETIKTVDLYFLHIASNNTWTKKYGHVLAHSTRSLK
ncbi:MAG: hypothetical protein RL329_592 [Bacteroidota bacterium]